MIASTWKFILGLGEWAFMNGFCCFFITNVSLRGVLTNFYCDEGFVLALALTLMRFIHILLSSRGGSHQFIRYEFKPLD